MAGRNFRVTAHRSEGWWALEVTGDDLGYPAYTQTRRLVMAWHLDWAASDEELVVVTAVHRVILVEGDTVALGDSGHLGE